MAERTTSRGDNGEKMTYDVANGRVVRADKYDNLNAKNHEHYFATMSSDG